MFKIRRDVTGERVLIASGRGARQYDFRSTAEERRERCPFCEGREDRTPPEVDAERANESRPDGPGWTVRVVPNLFPTFPREPKDSAESDTPFGVHEVVIESPDHDRGLADLPATEIAAVLRVWQRRLRAAREDSRIECGVIFKNHGERAGASLEHAHSQLMAPGFLPQRTAAELEAAVRGERAELMRAHRNSDLEVWSSSGVFGYSPRNARFAYELHLAPTEPQPRFEDAASDTIEAAADGLSRLLPSLPALHPSAGAFHVLVQTAPFRAARADRFWWRIDLIPRVAQIAGFELATGVLVNQVDPETAAEAWRKTLS